MCLYTYIVYSHVPCTMYVHMCNLETDSFSENTIILLMYFLLYPST
jgi:hypothetical protein